MTSRQRPAPKPVLPEGPQEGAPLAAWTYLAEDIPEHGLNVERTATPEEIDAVARTLGVRAAPLRLPLVLPPRPRRLHAREVGLRP
ncbi:hypothetical protein B4Q13_15805, partial [Lacticaseibacillus rhamnosus]